MTTLFYSIPAALRPGLDPSRFVAILAIERKDDQPLSEEDCRLIERIYAAELAAKDKPRPAKGAKKRAARSAAKELRAPAKRKAG